MQGTVQSTELQSERLGGNLSDARARVPAVVLAIELQDYFQAPAFSAVVPRRHWPRFEPRLPMVARRLADQLTAGNGTATFFADDWTASTHPDLLSELAARGHEIGCLLRGESARRSFDAAVVASQLRATRAAIVAACGLDPCGIRFGGDIGWRRDGALTALLAAEGFRYDAGGARRAAGPTHGTAEALPEIADMNRSVPVLGGFENFSALRHLPDRMWHSACAGAGNESGASPRVLVVKLWELDHEQPQITAGGRRARALHDFGIARASPRMAALLAEAPTTSIARRLGLEPAAVARVARAREPRVAASLPAAAVRTAATIVVPCYNEAPALSYLASSLDRFARDAGAAFELTYIFVDDASTDATVALLHQHFGHRPDCRIVGHARNRGVAAATLTGIEAATTEIVAVIDADCSYDPAEIARMIPLLDERTALVTASPYHPDGRVVGVPAWRLGLSRGLSALYGALLATRLHTYTACVRVYRKSAMADVRLKHDGYLGIAEIITVLDARGARIVESPAVLETRLFGQSKMKIARTIVGHLGLIAGLISQRFGSARPKPLEHSP